MEVTEFNPSLTERVPLPPAIDERVAVKLAKYVDGIGKLVLKSCWINNPVVVKRGMFKKL